MNDRLKSVQNLLLEALEIENVTERAAFLSDACGEDLALRQEIEELLRAQASAGHFLPENPAAEGARAAALGAAEALAAPLFEADTPVTEKPGDRIGRYKLLRKLGEGGCGTVYLAEQEQPVRRQVALKVIKLGMDTRQVVARFEAERQALALMDHPNIAKVFDASATENGRPYFVMELVRGIRITDYCEQNSLGTRERLELFIQVCQAVQHAHQKGVIHRDLKPSNILVTLNDNAPVPKVIDFGIAKATEGRLTGLTLFTAFEQFLGTPAYMSPEQAVLTSNDIDTRSDIYSLGVLLYELLTGTTPFDTKALLAAGLDELRRTIREKEPMRPSARLTQELVASSKQTTIKPAISTPPEKAFPRLPDSARPGIKERIHLLRGDLDWIVMKCLEKDRARRYETANGLARDIQRHLNSEPVVARPPSPLYEFQKTVRRHKLGFAAAAAVMITLAGGVLVSSLEAVQKDRERQRFQRNVVRQYVANGTRLANDGDLFGSLLWYAEALRLDAGDPRREEAHRIRIASVLRQCPKLLNVLSHGKMLYHAEFSPDGSKVLTASDDHTARLWDATTGRELLTLHHDGEVYDGGFSSDGLKIVTSSQDKTARLWDSRTGELIHSLKHGASIWQSRFTHDNRLLATACEDGTVQLWEVSTGNPLGRPLSHESRVDGLNFSADDRLLGTTTRNGRGYVWSVPEGQARFQGAHYGNGVLFSPDSRRFFTFDNQNIHCMEADTLKEAPFSPIPCTNVYNLALSSDGHTLAAATEDFTAQLWDTTTGKPCFPTPVRHSGPILMIDVSPDGRRFATAGQDTIAQLWSTSTGQPVGPPLKFIIHVKYIHFNSDGRRLLGSSCDQAARVWDLATSESLNPPSPGFQSEHRIITQDGNYLLQPGQSNVVWITDTRSLKRVAALPHSDPVTYASVSADGHSAITACEKDRAVSSMQNDIFLWDLPTGKRLNQYAMSHPFRLMYAAFSPDNTRLLTCGFDFTARLWDAHTGQALSQPLWHREQIRWGAFSPDGKSMATASWDRTVRVWDAFNGNPLTPPLLHHSIVAGARWSPDGKRLHTVTTDDFLQTWDLATGEPLTPPRKLQPGGAFSQLSNASTATALFENLPRDDRPVADLVLLAQMLAVGRIDASGNVVPLRLQELTRAWNFLRGKYPEQFAATTSEIVAWHEREAQDSKSEGNLQASLFHLNRALEQSPTDPNLAKANALAAARLQANNPMSSQVSAACSVPSRDPHADAGLVDLSAHYNLALSDSLNQRPDGNDLADLKPGVSLFGGVRFDVRGVVHLSGQALIREGQVFPEHVDGIRVEQKCRRLHFLQAAAWGQDVGTIIGSYLLHYSDGQQRELPIVFGRDIGGWWLCDNNNDSAAPESAPTAWVGTNGLASRAGCAICLYLSTRDNPRPDVQLASIDFKSSMSLAAPFLVAMTVDNVQAGENLVQKLASGARPASSVTQRERFPPRDAQAGPGQIDLSSFYNVELHHPDGSDFGDLQAGFRTLGGVPFDIRGAVYVTGQIARQSGSLLPERITGIGIGRKCRRLHFLQGAGWNAPPDTLVGKYVLHYVDGQQRELPIIFGQDTEAWWRLGPPFAPGRVDGAIPVWSGSNRMTQKDGCSLFLYKSTRDNPRPESELVSIDFLSSLSPAAPFLVALTVE